MDKIMALCADIENCLNAVVNDTKKIKQQAKWHTMDAFTMPHHREQKQYFSTTK